MRVGILAGGVGSRLSEETTLKPKPMVEIGGRPILWHIMKIYASQGFDDFVVALGYRGECIKRYMVDYCSIHRDLTVHLGNGRVDYQGENHREDWTVSLVDTGLRTNTGGRIKRLQSHLADGTSMLTWGDGVSNIDLRRLLDFHHAHGKLATVTAVRPIARFGLIELDGDRVSRFSEKPQLSEGWINGAFFVLEPGVFDYIEEGDDSCHWESGPMMRLAEDGELMAFKHEGYWQCMDTLRDKVRLERAWASGDAPWKVWK